MQPGDRLEWQPQPGPQTALIECPLDETFFGGARGGGKTDSSLGEWAIHADRYGKDAKGVFFRHRLPQLEAAMERAAQIYGPLKAKWNDQKKTWTFPSGATLKFRYLERLADAEEYQGHDYTRLYFEELTNWESDAPIRRVWATLRSGAGVPVRRRATGNPGGPGHHWVKARYVDPDRLGYHPIWDPVSKMWRVYIPSRLSDNVILQHQDPGYASRLYDSGSEALVKAWLDGDWDQIEGAYFPEFSADVHIVPPFTIPPHWLRFRAADWGSAKPFCVLWFAVSDGDMPAYPRGSLIVYREWYGWNGRPDEGCKLTAEEFADGVKQRDNGESITYAVMDPAAFAQQGGPSLCERMAARGVIWVHADNKRVARDGAMGGWDQLRQRLKGFDGRPGIFFFPQCAHVIRTLPTMQHDPNRPEDLDTTAEDHAVDACRYGVMSRPFVKDAPEKPAPTYPTQMTINQIMERAKRKRLELEGS